MGSQTIYGAAGSVEGLTAEGNILDMYQSWRRMVRSSRYIILERKSIPIVACIAQGSASSAADHQISLTGGLNQNTRHNGDERTNLVGVIELVVHESGMMAALPTAWSLRNTSLYLASADTTGAIASPRHADSPPRVG